MDHLREEAGVGKIFERSMTLPVLRLKGSPYEIGYSHGQQAQDKIQRNLEVYFRRFKNETALARDEALARAERYLQAIRRVSPSYARAMEGVALGSKTRLLEITALNVRYELMYSQFAKIGLRPMQRVDGCTAFGAMPEATVNRHLLMAENWDWIPQVEGLFLKIRPATGPNVLCFTEAGVVGGKIGLNSEGIGLAINGLISNADDWERLRKPFHVRCWEILGSKTLSQAISRVTRGERSCSANFLVGQQTKLGAGKIVDIESSPEATFALYHEDGILAHTNHFSNPRSGNGKMSMRRAEEMLRDHDGKPESVCRHENRTFPTDERYRTVVSVVMDLYTGQLHTTLGSPCEREYQTLRI